MSPMLFASLFGAFSILSQHPLKQKEQISNVRTPMQKTDFLKTVDLIGILLPPVRIRRPIPVRLLKDMLVLTLRSGFQS
jgi:hypothetical protein